MKIIWSIDAGFEWGGCKKKGREKERGGDEEIKSQRERKKWREKERAREGEIERERLLDSESLAISEWRYKDMEDRLGTILSSLRIEKRNDKK